MTIIPPGTRRRRPSDQEIISLELVSGLLMILGLFAFAYLFYAIATNDEIRKATQGLEIEGIGVDVNKVEQGQFVLEVEDNSPAAEVGFTTNDVLVQVGDTELDPNIMSRDTLNATFSAVFDSSDGDTIPVVVSRDGETRTIDVPRDTYEALFISSAENSGIIVNSISDSYFELQPALNGPADLAGIATGDRLTKVDDVEITPDMTVEQVESLLTEPNVKLEDDDFEITLEFNQVEANGKLNSQTRAVTKNVPPTTTLAYLNSFGFVVPIVTIIVGALLFRLGTKLRKYDVVAARYSLTAFMWLIIGLIVAAIRAFWVEGKGGLVTDAPFDWGKAFSSIVPYGIGIIPLALAYWWLSNHIDEFFVGEETLTSRNTRFAWSLLIPTLAVLILVAARPLEQSFIKSLTDDEFGTSRPARFVGFDNYQQLLSLRLTTVDCNTDDNSVCKSNRDGSINWQRSDFEEREAQKLRDLSSEERQHFVRYEEAFTWKLPRSNTGLRLLGKDPTFLKAFVNTLHFTIVSVILELILGLIIALVVHSNFKGRGLMRTAMLVPWSIPTVVSAVLWQVILRPDQTGIFNTLLMDLNLIDKPHQWFSSTGPWMNSIIAVDVWKTAPFMALLLLAGLQTIPADIYEAADVDGASKVRQFFTITLPLLRPTIGVALIFRTLDALRAFDVFQVLLDSTRPSLARYNYDQLVLNQKDGYASTVGVVIFIMILIFTVLYVRFVGIEQE